MNPWYGKAAILLASIVMIVIRAPYGQRSRKVKVVKSWKGPLEIALLTFAWAAFFATVIWIATPVFDFANYPLYPLPLIVGAACLALGLWLFQRSHVDLGTNWSITLELREQHQLVTHGLYRWVRHPMYLALLIYSLGQALVVPNWLVGPSYGVAMILFCIFRLGREEQMMLDEFGPGYKAYMATTKRVIPGVW